MSSKKFREIKDKSPPYVARYVDFITTLNHSIYTVMMSHGKTTEEYYEMLKSLKSNPFLAIAKFESEYNVKLITVENLGDKEQPDTVPTE